MTLLAVDRLCKRFGGVAAAKDVSFTLEAGELLAVIGPNGAGKSATFGMIGGQVRPDSGAVMLAGEAITGRPSREIWRRGVGRTFQVAQTFLSMTVAENVQMALVSGGRETRNLVADARALHRAEALAVLDGVGMAAAADRPVSELAYGDVKRVELAVALAAGPKLLLMDEPTAGMAPPERAALMALVARLARERRIGVLFTEHDVDAVFGHADRVLVLVRGGIIAAGPPDAVRRDERVRRAYLGMGGARRGAAAE
jgi:branched-chain amino acid transport system ATP-binding protein